MPKISDTIIPVLVRYSPILNTQVCYKPLLIHQLVIVKKQVIFSEIGLLKRYI